MHSQRQDDISSVLRARRNIILLNAKYLFLIVIVMGLCIGNYQVKSEEFGTISFLALKQKGPMARNVNEGVFVMNRENDVRRNKRFAGGETSQFIIKLKSDRKNVSKLSEMISLRGIPLGRQIFTLTTQLASLIEGGGGEIEKDIEWIGEYEARFKSVIDFEQIERESIRKDPEMKFSKFIDIQIMLISSVSAQIEGMEEDEAMNVQTILNSQFAQLFESSLYQPVRVVESNRMIMRVSPHILGRVYKVLAQNPHVHFIERQDNFEIMNKYSSISMQSTSPTSRSDNVFYKLGIFGKGQVVAVSDTGIDWDHCFFNDVKYPIIRNDTNMNSHRKIIRYDTVVSGNVRTDSMDVVDGHGTHVVGSIAGSLQNISQNLNISQYHGIAPEARIYFTDLSTKSSGLVTPDRFNDLFNKPYTYGNARIFSNSWGNSVGGLLYCQYDCKECKMRIDYGPYKKGDSMSSTNCEIAFGVSNCCEAAKFYSSTSYNVDYFLYRNQDAIVLYSSGNDGSMYSGSTIGNPAGAKNIVTVGASRTTTPAYKENIPYKNYESALYLYGYKTVFSCCGSTLKTVRMACCPQTIIDSLNGTVYNEDNLSTFSSKGPAVGNRIKPDIVGIGELIVSAYSDGNTASYQCGSEFPLAGNRAALTAKQGSSMSTPITAGGVALLREYLQKVMGISNPQGTLLKAALINSAIPLEGSVGTSSEDERLKISSLGTPNVLEGFGRVYLGNLVVNQRNETMDFKYMQGEVKTGNSSRSCFRILQGEFPSFRATLTWYDRPGTISTEVVLLHDLDLIINLKKIGNEKVTHVGNLGKSFDRLNTVEKVSFNSLNSSVYSHIGIDVYAQSVSDGLSQPFSVAISFEKGKMQQVDLSECSFTSPQDPDFIIDGSEKNPHLPPISSPISAISSTKRGNTKESNEKLIIIVASVVGTVLAITVIVLASIMIIISRKKKNSSDSFQQIDLQEIDTTNTNYYITTLGSKKLGLIFNNYPCDHQESNCM